jgi:parallel beta-helix repeat protein
VAVTGVDTADGSAAAPWRTIQRAADLTPAGGTIVVRAGTYAPFAITRSGLTVQAAAGQVVTISGGTYVVLVKGVTSATVRGLVIRDAPSLWGSGVRVETSQNVLVEGNDIRENHSFGIKVKDATNVTIRDNEITKNDTGIELSGAVGGTLVVDNDIHHNDRMVTSSRGGNGIVFTKTTGRITATGNRLWGNRARHLTDAGYDGGAFEVYAASDLVIRSNLLWDNNNAMETGTDGTAPCSRIEFTRNTVLGLGTVAGETTGMILRCADSSTIAHNVFDGVDDYAFYLSNSGGYAGSIVGLRIANNIVVRARAYSLGSGIPAGLLIDYNLVFPGGSQATYSDRVAYVSGRGNTTSLAEFRSWTGYEVHGLQADPLFVDRAAGNYRLQVTSPAVDAGMAVTSEPHVGAAPDMGAFELTP